jgi:hypothetical protein
MSVETKPNKLVKGLVLDTFHTDVDNTVATYALNSQLEDQEGNHFHYGSEVGTTFIKNIPDTHVVVGHINMERNETVLFTTDGTNSTIGILSRNDDMSYQYEIKVDDTKQTKKLGFKKNIYIRGVYRLLNGCDKVIYFVDGINKDRRINLNQLDSYKLPTTVTSGIIFDNNISAIIYNISTLTGDIKIIRVLSPTNIFTQSNVVANLIRAVNFQSNLSTSSSILGNISFVQKAQANLSALASLSGDINFVQKAQASLLTSASVTGNITIPKTFNASLLATGTTTADLTVGASVISIDYLVVAGGGSGGGTTNTQAYSGGGGGAGGFRPSTNFVISPSIALQLTIGAGGAGAPSNSANGFNSVFSSIISIGGGRGGFNGGNGFSGGSGGGGSYGGDIGGAGTSGQGNAGGNGVNLASGGGGGAGSIGSNGTIASGGNGGSGLTSSISGINIGYAGGGGGGSATNTTFRPAGTATDGGGAGAGSTSTAATPGTANTGGGGGGTSFNYYLGGGNGGSGIIIIKIPDTVTATFSAGVTQTTSTSGGFKIITVTAAGVSDTVTFS